MARKNQAFDVTRQGLIERLLSGETNDLVIVCAPAGFGKTMLLKAIYHEAGAKPLRAGCFSFRDPEAAELVRKLLASEPTDVLLLDDADSAPIDFLTDLVDRIEQGNLRSRIFLSARTLHLLPIARLRAMGRITLINSSELCFTRAETIDAFGRRAGTSARKLYEKAEGWPAATELIAQWLARGGRFGSDDEMLYASGLGDYIETEIAATLSSEQRSALIHAGIVSACTREMLDSIDPEADEGRHLPDIADQLHGLINHSNGRYDLVPPLRIWTMHVFDRLPAQARLRALNNAADICATTGDIVEAVEIVMRTGEPHKVADYVRRAGGVRLWVIAGYNVIRALVKQAGPAVVSAEPQLMLLKCIMLQKDGEIAEAEKLLNEAISRLGNPTERRDAEVVRATLLVYGCRRITSADVDAFRRAVLRRGDDSAWKSLILTVRCILNAQRASFSEAIANAVEARLYAESAGSTYNLLFLNLHLAGIALARGQLAEARKYISAARRRWKSDFVDDIGAETVVSALSAMLDFEAGRLSASRTHLRKSAARMPHAEAWFDIYVAAYEPMGRLLAQDEGVAAALAYLENARIALVAQGLERVGELLDLIAACIAGESWLKTGVAVRDIPHPPDLPENSAWQEREAIELCRTYYLLMSGEHEEALTVIERLIAYCRSKDLGRSQLRALLLQVEVLDRANLSGRADAIFADAIELAAATGQIQAFREFGGRGVCARIGQISTAINHKTGTDHAAVRLINRLSRGASHDPDGSQSKDFTKRERDVLAALDRGGSDKVIGRRLGVSEHAIRFHLKNIFRKLRATDRVEALHRARAAGVVPVEPIESSSIH